MTIRVYYDVSEKGFVIERNGSNACEFLSLIVVSGHHQAFKMVKAYPAEQLIPYDLITFYSEIVQVTQLYLLQTFFSTKHVFEMRSFSAHKICSKTSILFIS